MAEAERDTAEKRAAAKIRMAEGIQAEAAATGLAEVKVKEADAIAVEKMGEAEAKALLEKMRAEAEGLKQQGLSKVYVQDAEAGIIEKRGMAEVKVKEADADAVEKQGIAEARALQEKLLAEAHGLAEKFKSLDALSDAGREHEEFRYRLDQQLNIASLDFEAQKVVAEKQAQILAEAFKNAKIDIVGGEQMFFDRVIGATSMAKAADGFVRNSEAGQVLLKDYLSGDSSLLGDIKEVLSNPAFSSEDLQNLTLSAFLAKAMQASNPEQKDKLARLQKYITKAGIGDVQA